jgi:glycosyltransferase involved in cell wall biosynthesis
MSLLSVQPSQIGGAGTYIQELLAEFGRRDIDVQVLANSAVMSDYRELATERIAFHHVSSFALGTSNLSRLRATAGAMLAPSRLAALNLASANVMHYPAAVAVPQTKLPTVLTLHDIQHHDLPHFFSRSMRAYRAIFYDREARRATIVVTVSEHARSRLVDVLGLDPARVDVIYHGIDHTSFRPEPAEDDAILEPFDLPARFIVYPAAALLHKNHIALIEAFKRAGLTDISLVFCGPPFERKEELLAYAEGRGLGNRVLHLGFVDRQVIPALYRRATALIFPSLYEGFGAPPLEAMACGCPVGSSNAGSLPEVCGNAALMFDPESIDAMAGCIQEIVGNDTTRTTLRQRGLEHAKAFTWKRAADLHLEAYGRALDVHG